MGTHHNDTHKHVGGTRGIWDLILNQDLSRGDVDDFRQGLLHILPRLWSEYFFDYEGLTVGCWVASRVGPAARLGVFPGRGFFTGRTMAMYDVRRGLWDHMVTYFPTPQEAIAYCELKLAGGRNGG